MTSAASMAKRFLNTSLTNISVYAVDPADGVGKTHQIRDLLYAGLHHAGKCDVIDIRSIRKDLYDMAASLPRSISDDVDAAEGITVIQLPVAPAQDADEGIGASALLGWWQITDTKAAIVFDDVIFYVEDEKDGHFGILGGFARVQNKTIDTSSWSDINADPFFYAMSLKVSYSFICDTPIALAIATALMMAEGSLIKVVDIPEKLRRSNERKGRFRPHSTITLDVSAITMSDEHWSVTKESTGETIEVPYILHDVRFVQHAVQERETESSTT